MKVDKEMNGVLESLGSLLTKETLVNKSKFNQQTGRKLQDQWGQAQSLSFEKDTRFRMMKGHA